MNPPSWDLERRRTRAAYSAWQRPHSACTSRHEPAFVGSGAMQWAALDAAASRAHALRFSIWAPYVCAYPPLTVLTHVHRPLDVIRTHGDWEKVFSHATAALRACSGPASMPEDPRVSSPQPMVRTEAVVGGRGVAAVLVAVTFKSSCENSMLVSFDPSVLWAANWKVCQRGAQCFARRSPRSFRPN